MTEPKRCLEEGMLAGMDFAMPPFDIAWLDREQSVPCCNVVCSDCGAVVRRIDGHALRPEKFRKPADYAALYAAEVPDPAVLKRVGSGATSRSYVCRCSGCSVGGAVLLSTGGPDAWSCGGHRFDQGFALD